MKRIFIIDDEAIMRSGLCKAIEKKPDLYTVCGEASDGEMALAQLLELRPDIIISDICMPFMDGIDLSTHIKKILPFVHIVIISGYDQFEYAQRCISIGVDCYLLKPLDSARLLEVLSEVSRRIDEEKHKFQDLKQMKEQIDFESDMLRESFLNHLLIGDLPLNSILELAQKYEIDIIARKYIVLYLKLADTVNEELLQIRFLIANTLCNRNDIIWFLSGTNQFIAIVKGSSEEEVLENAYGTSQTLQHELYKKLNKKYAVQIGTIVGRLGSLSQSYNDAYHNTTQQNTAASYSEEVQHAMQYINDHYMDSSLTLFRVASEVGFSPSHFSTIFSREVGKTLIDYLTGFRIERAKELLENNSSILDVAEKAGYSDAKYFGYVFKRTVGLSPREFRNKYAGSQQQ
ncbi:response regulator [Ruminococcus sp. OA3]|uniref:response regulator transcription factor n=1 Tax=Ruminococcus sp. OA3 TaxID=2914164 RepID=UPI001F069705|nr:response regulator [Ruminococcus sp. OA3]MCH1981355.1 response regulator [Ruminococcus sp. OA3]